MKILAFAGSNSRNSINKEFVSYVSGLFTGHSTEILDLNDYEMPIYSIDREQESLPDLAKDFAEKIDASDLILISLAEHNGTYTSAFKNIFDWVSRVPNRPHFGDKFVFLMSTAPGARGGASVLEMAVNRFPHNGANVVAQFSLPFFSKNFSTQIGITDEEKARELQNIITELLNKIA